MYQIQETQMRATEKKNLMEAFKNENGAIDLASIMVGIIVIGLIGGVIAATVFAVIPWVQDNAAKQQLDSIVAAEHAYHGLSSSTPSPLPAGAMVNSYGDSAQLSAAGLLTEGQTYCVTTSSADASGFIAFSYSASGKTFTATDKQTKPAEFTGSVPTACRSILPPEAPYIDPDPTKTILTYRCDTTTTGAIPLYEGLTGTETWNDGSSPRTYNGDWTATLKTLNAGQTYTVTFDGTYNGIRANISPETSKLTGCLRSVDHWGSDTWVTNGSYAFYDATNLTDVPEHIPASLSIPMGMFYNASSINDPDISKWDTANFNNLTGMFSGASSFNQPINDWDTSQVTVMGQAFQRASAFNQPLDNWDTSQVTFMANMFEGASSFNQPLNTWNVSKVEYMSDMFNGARAFDQPLNNWDVSKVTMMHYMFFMASDFNQDLSGWNTASVSSGDYFAPNSFPTEFLPAKVTKSPW